MIIHRLLGWLPVRQHRDVLEWLVRRQQRRVDRERDRRDRWRETWTGDEAR